MKKRAPGWQKKQERKEKVRPVFSESSMVMRVGKDAERGWDDLMHRMKTGESTVFFLDDDLTD